MAKRTTDPQQVPLPEVLPQDALRAENVQLQEQHETTVSSAD